MERRHLVFARGLARPPLVPERRRRHGRAPAQLVRHRRQHGRACIWPLHASDPQGQDARRQHRRMGRRCLHGRDLLGLASTQNQPGDSRPSRRIHVHRPTDPSLTLTQRPTSKQQHPFSHRRPCPRRHESLDGPRRRSKRGHRSLGLG